MMGVTRWRELMLVRVLASVASAAAAGCGDDLPSIGAGSSSGAADGSGSSSGSSSGTASHPPEVVDIGQDVLLLREGEAVVLTVVVHDPDDDVISGELLGPGEPARYAELSPHPSNRWTASVSWSDVHSRWSLQFEGETALAFRVHMVDAAGHVAEAETTLRAACGGLTDTACGGTCIDPQVDPMHCGGCDRPCEVKEPLMGQRSNGGCVGGSCQPWWGECFEPAAGLTCASQCAVEGARCVAQGCSFASTLMSHDLAGTCENGWEGAVEAIACDVDLGGWGGMVAARCCCG
jgi:hypothetical protein